MTGASGTSMITGRSNGAAKSVPAGRPDLREIGDYGLTRSYGVIQEEIAAEFRGARWDRRLREMIDSDPVIGGILFAIEMLVRQVSYDILPADDTNRAHEIAQFFREAMFDDMSFTWQDTLSEIFSFVPWGWAATETVYKYRDGDSRDPTRQSRFTDGKVGWRKWAIRPQETRERWVFDENGGVQALVQSPPPEYRRREIPIERLLLFRTTSRKNSPEGRSVLRTAAISWYYKTNIQRIEAIGVERDLAGLPVAWVPSEVLSSTASTGEAALLAEIKKIIVNIRRDDQEGVVMPLEYDDAGNKVYDLELLSSGGQRNFDTDKIINRYDSRIAQCLLADFILLGHQAVGSFALSDSKTHLFSVALGSLINSMCDVVNRHAIPKLGRLNDFPTDLMPKLTHGDIEQLDLGILGDYITKLAAAGVPLFPNSRLEQWLLEQANAPVPTEEEIGERERQQEEQQAAAAAMAKQVQPPEGDDDEAPGRPPAPGQPGQPGRRPGQRPSGTPRRGTRQQPQR